MEMSELRSHQYRHNSDPPEMPFGPAAAAAVGKKPISSSLSLSNHSPKIYRSVVVTRKAAPSPPLPVSLVSSLTDELWMSTDAIFSNKVTWLLILGPIAILGETLGVLSEAASFMFAGIALIPCAERLSFVTEQVAEHTNGTIGALLNATFGNAPELLISIAALKSGYYRVVQLTMLGSMLTNMMLVFGISCIIGGCRYRVQYVRQTSGNVSVVLLLLATAGSLFPAALVLSGQFPSPELPSRDDNETTLINAGGEETAYRTRGSNNLPSQEEVTLCRVNAAVMLVLYICYLIFQLGTHSDEFDDDDYNQPTNLPVEPNVACQRFGKLIINLFSRFLLKSRQTPLNPPQQFLHHLHSRSDPNLDILMNDEIPEVKKVDTVDDEEAALLKSTKEKSVNHWHTRFAESLSDHGSYDSDREGCVHSLASFDDDADDDSDDNSTLQVGVKTNLNIPRPPRRRRKKKKANDLLGSHSNHSSHSPRSMLSNMLSRTKSKNSDIAKADEEDNDNAITCEMSILSEDPVLMSKLSNISENAHRSDLIGRNLVHYRQNSIRNQFSYGDNEGTPSKAEKAANALISFRVGIIWLFIITLCISAMSDILVDTIDGFAGRMHLSQVFTSMVIIPFFSNVAEQVSAFIFAYRNKMDLCVGVTVGSAIQIATFVLPGAVLIGMALDRNMTLYFHTYETVCLFFGVVVIAAILQGGTTNWLVGAMLVGIYIMFAAGIWFHEKEELSVDVEKTLDR